MPGARTTRTLLLAALATTMLAGSAAIMGLTDTPSLLHYAASGVLFLAALFFASGAYAVWSGQIGMVDEPARDRED